MSLFIVVNEDGVPLNIQSALTGVIQGTVDEMVIKSKYDEALEAFSEEVQRGDREPPVVILPPHL